MDDELNRTYTITLSDGTEITGLRRSGNNFISNATVTEQMFNGKLDSVTITDDRGIIEEMHDAELVQITQYPTVPGYYFILRQPTEAEIADKKLRADVDYLALMTDTDLEA